MVTHELGLRHSAVVIAGAISACFATPAQAQICTPFNDVAVADPFCANIQWMYNRAITLGCAANQYCPAQFVRRDQMAAFMNRLGDIVFEQGGNAFGATAVLGTSDAQALELWTNNARIARYEPNAISPNILAGHPTNTATAGVRGATISGGGNATGNSDPDFFFEGPNRVFDAYGTVSGGYNNVAGDGAGTPIDRAFATVGGGAINVASAVASTIAGGAGNTASGSYSSVVGGSTHTASGPDSVVAGGYFNRATGSSSTIVGGYTNVASGSGSTVLGGLYNIASGALSIAAGRDAHADQIGCIVFSAWSTRADTACGAPYTVRFFSDHGMSVEYGAPAPTGGGTQFFYVGDLQAGLMVVTSTGASVSNAGVWNSVSDAAAKEDFEDLDTLAVLDKVASLPIRSWRYKVDPAGTRHIGPTAQDFGAAFASDGRAKTIGMVDADGVALAAIQGLNAKLELRVYEQARELDAERAARAALAREIARQRDRLATLERAIEALTGSRAVSIPMP